MSAPLPASAPEHPSAAVSTAPWVEVSPAPEATWVALGAGVVFFVVGLYLNGTVGYIEGDAMSRVGNAFYVLFSRDPHLGAIGFIWNPLPSMAALPLVLLHGLWPALVRRGIAGIVVSAAFSGVGARALARLGGRFGLGLWTRLAIAAVYVVNPMTLLYGANGMSDGMLVACTLGAMDGVVAYIRSDRMSALVSAAFWVATAFLVRYEGAPFGVFLAIALVVAMWISGRRTEEWESALLLFASPVVYAGFLWVFANWLIMKNPLYFLTSQYGNVAQTATGSYVDPMLAAARHHPLVALAFAGRFTLLFWPVIPGAAAAIIALLRRPRDPVAPLLLVLAFGIPLFEAAFIDLGASAGWVRFFFSYIPGGFVFAAWWLGRVRAKWLWTLAVILGLVAGDAGTFWALTRPNLGRGSQTAVLDVLQGTRANPFATTDPIDTYLDRRPHLLVLADTFDAYQVVLRAANPKQFVITSDRNFHAILANPRGRVDMFLVPPPQGVSALDAINVKYPGLWAGHVSWAHLVKTFAGNFRLYRIGPNAP